jgi:hypothetical protein
VRVPAEDIKQIATVIDGREYRARAGWFEMPEHHARAHLQSAGYGQSWQTAGVTARRRVGFRCGACGRGSFFKRCGKCGAECIREA